MWHDLTRPIRSGDSTLAATWLTVYLLVPFALITSVYMIKLGARLLIDWCYVWVMAALGIWVARIVYITRIHPQPIGHSWWSLVFALDLLAAMIFTLYVLVRTGLRHAQH